MYGLIDIITQNFNLNWFRGFLKSMDRIFSSEQLSYTLKYLSNVSKTEHMICIATQQPDVSAYTRCVENRTHDLYSHTTATRIGIYQMRCTAYKSCSWWHIEHLMENKDWLQESVHLVGLYTYCKMMHGAYKVKLYSWAIFTKQKGKCQPMTCLCRHRRKAGYRPSALAVRY